MHQELLLALLGHTGSLIHSPVPSSSSSPLPTPFCVSPSYATSSLLTPSELSLLNLIVRPGSLVRSLEAFVNDARDACNQTARQGAEASQAALGDKRRGRGRRRTHHHHGSQFLVPAGPYLRSIARCVGDLLDPYRSSIAGLEAEALGAEKAPPPPPHHHHPGEGSGRKVGGEGRTIPRKIPSGGGTTTLSLERILEVGSVHLKWLTAVWSFCSSLLAPPPSLSLVSGDSGPPSPPPRPPR